MSTPESRPVAPPAPRVLRWVALGGLTLASMMLLGLLVVSLVPALQEGASDFVRWDATKKFPVVKWSVSVAGFIVLWAASFVLAAWRLHSWRWIGAGYVAVAIGLIYLAIDDPAIRHPLTVDDISPAYPGAEQSFEVLMRYGKRHPLAQSFSADAYKVDANFKWEIRKPGPWREAITAHRTELEKHWASLTAERAWWAELNAFDRIGDLTPATQDAEIISFAIFRVVSQRAVAIASLEALDGRGDDAIATLLPILQVGRKLQSPSRTLVRFMVGVVLERLSLDAANFVLNNTAVSPPARARLVAALQGGNPEAGARHIIKIEYAMAFGMMVGMPIGDSLSSIVGEMTWARRPLNALSPFLYNPRATFNLYGDLTAELQDLVGRRQIESLDPRLDKFMERDARRRFKNFMGRLLLWQMIPSYTKVTDSYWQTQDTRAALIERLGKP